jgi:CBS-domain-containing membrane protein
VDVTKVLIPTQVIRAGMVVRELFQECGRCHVQALPFCDEQGRLKGRITLKNVLRVSCLPEYIIQMAPVLGPQMSCVENAEAKAREILCKPVEPYVQTLHHSVDSGAPLIKALALMEQHDTSYIFVVDDGDYKGIITVSAIATAMANLEACSMDPAVPGQ